MTPENAHPRILLYAIPVVLAGLCACEQEDTGVPSSGACVMDQVPMSRYPVDMILIVDRSGSMDGNLWDTTVQSLNEFFLDPRSAGIRVGMNLFPGWSYSLNSCNPTLYDPLQVAPQALPSGASLLSDAFDVGAGGATPMYGALDGTYQYATNFALNNPGYKVIVVLTSDGAPSHTVCAEHYGGAIDYGDTMEIASLAQAAYDTHGIETYTIAFASAALFALNGIAVAGGTTAAIDVSLDINQFATRIAEIRDSVATGGCEYGIPQLDLPASIPFEPGKVNIYLTEPGEAPVMMPRVSGEADCGASDAWYYDREMQPTQVILCSGTCAYLDISPQTGLLFEYGCETETR